MTFCFACLQPEKPNFAERCWFPVSNGQSLNHDHDGPTDVNGLFSVAGTKRNVIKVIC